MRSPLQQARVLCISRDPQLLNTRQMVFETRYDAVSIGSVDEMRSSVAAGEFDFLILCHSLSAEESENAVGYARFRWP